MDKFDRYYNIGGLVLRVSGSTDELYKNDGVLLPFITDKCEDSRHLRVTASEKLTPPQGDCVFCDANRQVYCDGKTHISYIGSVKESVDNAYLRIERRGVYSDVQVRRFSETEPIGAKIVLKAMEIENLMAEHNGLLIHASCIIHGSGAILFTARSGTGKSTQAELWRQHRNAEIVNGDRIIVRNINSRYWAYGVPYSGSSGICKQMSAPLRAVVCLKQAPTTTVKRIGGVRAFRNIWEGCTVQVWSKNDTDKSVETAIGLVDQVPVYELACTPDESAVYALEAIMTEENQDKD